MEPINDLAVLLMSLNSVHVEARWLKSRMKADGKIIEETRLSQEIRG